MNWSGTPGAHMEPPFLSWNERARLEVLRSDLLGQSAAPVVEKPFGPRTLRQLIHEQLQKR